MSRMRQIRKEAPLLLEATKDALRFVRSLDAHELPEEEAKRQQVMATLAKAIEKAEPLTFDERDTSVRLVMSPACYAYLVKTLKERASREKDYCDVVTAVEENTRHTKQRVYLTLAINPVILRHLKFVLDHTKTTLFDRPFTRMSKQIKEEGLTKNPMEILAKMGL